MAKQKPRLPELLAPAGSLLALEAAIEGGADAVYLGGTSFNARINAKNFTPEELLRGISLAHMYGVKVYIAANTLIFERERDDFLRAAESVYKMGADALIIADLGMASEVARRIPLELHASTQMSGHCIEAAEHLAKMGFSRMVCAREMSRDDLALLCRHSPIETEVFVHGALCVSVSGQCLFSSVVGGRSGNRGMCAQPCRLPYSSPCARGRAEYPLSLRDLSLAEHLCELIDMGAASLKIEGRMKSPEYVRDVVSRWRILLDEGRNASKQELAELAQVFSRGGLTDGYYSRRINRTMLGIRSDADKRASLRCEPFGGITKKLPVALRATLLRSRPSSLSVFCGEKSFTAYGDIPQEALTAPLSREVVCRNLQKLGGTSFCVRSIDVKLDDGIMLPISRLNALRRDAILGLEAALTEVRREGSAQNISPAPLAPALLSAQSGRCSALFYDVEPLNDAELLKAVREFFDEIFVPLEHHQLLVDKAFGVMLPEVIYDSQRKAVLDMLKKAAKEGTDAALVGNLGHLELVRSAGLRPFGDLRLNATNSASLSMLQALGIERTILSPELSLRQVRELSPYGAVVVYGRLPLMITEKCVGKELGGCESCRSGNLSLVDRLGIPFPVLRRYEHRSAIFNSVPIYMADRLSADNFASHRHFIFTTETKKEIFDVLRAYSCGLPPSSDKIRRIK